MSPHGSNPTAAARGRCLLARSMAVLWIALTAAVSLLWSHAKLLSQDEMYAFQTDRVPTWRELVQVQEHWPISLDPLLYHALAHAAMGVFGVGAFALRLPAFLGFLLMQVCLFLLVRNMAGERAGAVAAALPALTFTLYYSAEGRPYGLLLGLYALALLCWQLASRRAPTAQDTAHAKRIGALLGLALAVAATLNAHYFGILLLVPLSAGELWRSVERRRRRQRFDWPVALALMIGMAGVVFTKPFLAGAAEFKRHYYNAGGVGLHDITRAYRSMFLDYTKMPMRLQHLAMVVLVLYAVALVWGCWRVRRARTLQASPAEWVALLALAALPFCGYLLARFVTHSIEVRYVLGAAVALSAMTALALAPYLRRDAVFNTLATALGLGILITGAARIRAEQRATQAELASLVLPADVRTAIRQSPSQLLYIQDMGTFEIASYYEPDPQVRAHMTLVYSEDEELRWDRHDTMSLTAMHMEHFAGLRVEPYSTIHTEPGPHVFLLQHSGWDWTDQAFAQDHATVTPLGQTAGADAAAVVFPAPAPAQLPAQPQPASDPTASGPARRLHGGPVQDRGRAL